MAKLKSASADLHSKSTTQFIREIKRGVASGRYGSDDVSKVVRDYAAANDMGPARLLRKVHDALGARTRTATLNEGHRDLSQFWIASAENRGT